MRTKFYMIDRRDPRNQAWIDGAAESFCVWIERSSFQWCMVTAAAFHHVDFMIIEVTW